MLSAVEDLINCNQSIILDKVTLFTLSQEPRANSLSNDNRRNAYTFSCKKRVNNPLRSISLYQ